MIRRRIVDEIFTAEEVSKILKIGKSTVYHLAKSGVLPSIKIPRCGNSIAKKMNRYSIRFAKKDLKEFVFKYKNVKQIK